MSRISSSGHVDLKSTSGVRESVVSNLKSFGFEITLIEENYLEARRGSQLIFRTKGGFLANEQEFPIVACISLRSEGGKGLLEIAVHEDLGIGSLLGARKKYQKVCDSVLRDLLERY